MTPRRFTAPQRGVSQSALPADHPRAIFPEARLDAPRAENQLPNVADLRGRIRAIEEQTRGRREHVEAPDPGEIVATFPRADGTALRVALRRWKDPKDTRPGPGALFVDVRVWQSDGLGAWPVKGKGLSVRASEIAFLAGALLDAAARIARRPK